MRGIFASGVAILIAAGLASPWAAAQEGALRIDGYLQARAVATERPTAAYTDDGTSFLVRRARVRFTHDVGIARFVVQLDGAASANPIIRDAYVQVPFGPGDTAEKPFCFWAGQFKVPFGYTIPESSRVRLFPERPVGFETTVMGNALFPTVRDRGVRLTYTRAPLQADLAVVNGGGINAPTNDPDNSKDLYGRLEYRFGVVSAVASARVGSQRVGTVDRQRSVWGLGIRVTPLLTGELSAEYAAGLDAVPGRAEPEAWYVQYLYPLNARWKVGARYSAWDPDTENIGVPGAAGEERGPGFVVAYQPDARLRFTGAVDLLRVTADAQRRSATVGVLQTQYAF